MFPPKVREKLKHYVYLYVDPRTNVPFYIGKGKGNRAFSHLKSTSETAKAKVISELNKLGKKPRIEILKHGLSEEQALLVEATAIDLLDVKKLTNVYKGHDATRASVEEIIAQLSAKKIDVKVPAVLIKIARAFYYGMSPQELYDTTRSAWVVGPRREKAQYALSVYRGIVREVYVIAGWVRGGSTMRATDVDGWHEEIPDRWEFVGKIAKGPIHKQYYGKSVAHYFPDGAQNPIKYVNC